MLKVFASRRDTCPAWCVTEHGELAGEDDHLHTSAGLRLAPDVAARLCATVDPDTGEVDGPYVLVESEEWTLERARSVGQALIALTEQAQQSEQADVDDGRGR